jgi:DNA-binding transcriptional MerR regulator
MTIGDFSRITHLSSKALRHYHREGVLIPDTVDPVTGYRGYHVDQVPVANLIRRLRALGVPVATVRRVLGTDDPAERRRTIVEHLAAMEAALAETQRAVDSLRDLVDDSAAPEVGIEHRADPARPALVVAETIDVRDLGGWYAGALAALEVAAAASGARVTGPAGGMWSTALFLDERGEALLYLPVDAIPSRGPDGRAEGRVRAVTLPPAELAVAVHRGSDATIERTYAALGRYVVRHELGVDGPIRERYLRTGDEDAVTEIGWPVLGTRPVPPAPGDAVPSTAGR